MPQTKGKSTNISGWKPYYKQRFSLLGVFNPIDEKKYPTRTAGQYVFAICISKLSSDTGVVLGQTYPLFWPDFGAKCDAPVPPFKTGEGIGRLSKSISYKGYDPNKFKIIGDFSPTDPNVYPKPGNDGVYKVAECKVKLSSDTDVVVGGTYIVIVYPLPIKKLDAPNPPFKTGDGIGKSKK